MDVQKWLSETTVEQVRATEEANKRTWPSEDERRGDIHWTARYARPTRASHPNAGAAYLASLRDIWDEAELKRRQHIEAVEKLTEDRETQDAAERAKRDHRREQDRIAADAALVQSLRSAFFAGNAGATEIDFQTALPELRRGHQIDEAQAAERERAARSEATKKLVLG